MIVSTGIDILEISRFDGVRPGLLARFLTRVYTPDELAEAGDSQETWAGLFAAKEAVSKALGTGIGPVSWRDIEIRNGPAGEPRLTLHGKADKIARQKGLSHWSVSISHSRTHAVAVAVALGE
jgi:holo-[acyl-carrier protein] synthase